MRRKDLETRKIIEDSKKMLYPKTKRIGDWSVVITEKLDGANIGFFKKEGKLVIATRETIYHWIPGEKTECKYRGLQAWLDMFGEDLLNSINETSGFFGEWLGTGRGRYPEAYKRVYMFAKANIDEDYGVYNIYYDHGLFIYPFKNQIIPAFIEAVPVVEKLSYYPSIEELDLLYDKYVARYNRFVEGFIIELNNTVMKYVRYKKGKLTPHKK